MEEDEAGSAGRTIPPWVKLEYTHMRTLAGPDAKIIFTHLSESSCASLSNMFASATGPLATTSCHQTGILDLLGQFTTLDKVCLLDPKAEIGLSPEDGYGRFDVFLFGWYSGDDPPRDRTAELRVIGFPARNLGPVQMTTDTALGVTKIVVQDQIPMDKIPYIDYPTIRFTSKESVEMPFRYIRGGSEPRLPPGMRELLHEDLNKSFEF
ncbi:SAM-dependent RNA methyltransferase [Infundibulicybe gibba]|nr:SAM-dependent RNA methyltransferase [Infundibulicybe gibba]